MKRRSLLAGLQQLRDMSSDEGPQQWRLFFRDEEPAMQLHVPTTEHINCHPYCLHLWRPLEAEIPMPPDWMVGPKTGDES